MNMDILVVDDDEVLRRELSEWLSREGHDVRTADSGEEAVKMVKNQDFNLLFTDLKMPNMGGMELLKAVRKVRPNLHTVMITAYGTIDTAVEAMKIGADDYICKPFEVEQLQSVIESMGKTIEFEEQIKRIGLAEETKSRDPFEFFGYMIRDNKALCITQQNPEMIKGKYGLQDVSMIWLNPDEKCDSCLHPKNIYELKLTINGFFKENPKGVVLLDGVEALIEHHSWDIVRKFISDVSNVALHEPSHLIISIKPDRIEESTLAELKRLLSRHYIQRISESLSSPIRRHILRFLSYQGSSNFTGILRELKLKDPPKLSFHLKKLVNVGIVQKDAKKGYSLTNQGKNVAEYLSTLENKVILNAQKNVSLILSF